MRELYLERDTARRLDLGLRLLKQEGEVPWELSYDLGTEEDYLRDDAGASKLLVVEGITEEVRELFSRGLPLKIAEPRRAGRRENEKDVKRNEEPDESLPPEIPHTSLTDTSIAFLAEKVFFPGQYLLRVEPGKSPIDPTWVQKFSAFILEANDRELEMMAQKIFQHIQGIKFPYFFSMVVSGLLHIDLNDLAQGIGYQEHELRDRNEVKKLLHPTLVKVLKFLQQKFKSRQKV